MDKNFSKVYKKKFYRKILFSLLLIAIFFSLVSVLYGSFQWWFLVSFLVAEVFVLIFSFNDKTLIDINWNSELSILNFKYFTILDNIVTDQINKNDIKKIRVKKIRKKIKIELFDNTLINLDYSNISDSNIEKYNLN